MKDIKIPQLIINDLTKSQYDEAEKENLIQEDELYITDEIHTEIPLCFGQWSTTSPGDNWAKVTDEYVEASKYQEVWDIITAILDGELEHRDIKVITKEDYDNSFLNKEDWEKNKLEQKYAYYYIVNKDNNTFKMPRCIKQEQCIGVCDVSVISGATAYDGVYSISSQGEYLETSCFARLEKCTKTGTIEKEIIVDGKQIVIEFNCPSDKINNIACPTGAIKLYEVSSRGNIIHNLKGFKNGSVYTLSFAENVEDITLYLPAQYLTSENTEYEYKLFFQGFEILKKGYKVEKNNQRVKVDVELQIKKEKFGSIEVPRECFIPTATQVSYRSFDIQHPHCCNFSKKGNDTDGYYYTNGVRNAVSNYTEDELNILDTSIVEEIEKEMVYHKPTQWSDSTSEIPFEVVEDDRGHKCVVTSGLTSTLHQELINDKYAIFICYTKANAESDSELLLSQIDFAGKYCKYMEVEKTQTHYTLVLGLYDEENHSCEELKDAMPEGVNETILLSSIKGYTLPPKVSEYNLNENLYIKVG